MFSDDTLSSEEWRDIPFHEGVYQVSNYGRVKRIKSCRGYFAGRILKPTLDTKNGYLRIDLRGKTVTIHRMVAFVFLGLPPSPLHTDVNHKDGNKQNNKASNLEWTTRSENVKHAVLNGLQHIAMGEEQAQAKLTEIDVREIRRRYIKGQHPYLSELAAEYSVDKSLIHRIVIFKSWRHVK